MKTKKLKMLSVLSLYLALCMLFGICSFAASEWQMIPESWNEFDILGRTWYWSADDEKTCVIAPDGEGGYVVAVTPQDEDEPVYEVYMNTAAEIEELKLQDLRDGVVDVVPTVATPSVDVQRSGWSTTLAERAVKRKMEERYGSYTWALMKTDDTTYAPLSISVYEDLTNYGAEEPSALVWSVGEGLAKITSEVARYFGITASAAGKLLQTVAVNKFTDEVVPKLQKALEIAALRGTSVTERTGVVNKSSGGYTPVVTATKTNIYYYAVDTDLSSGSDVYDCLYQVRTDLGIYAPSYDEYSYSTIIRNTYRNY